MFARAKNWFKVFIYFFFVIFFSDCHFYIACSGHQLSVLFVYLRRKWRLRLPETVISNVLVWSDMKCEIITDLCLSAAAGSEYYEHESSSVSISNRHVQNIFHKIRNGRASPLYECEDGASNRSFHQKHGHRKDTRTVSHLEDWKLFLWLKFDQRKVRNQKL